MDDADNLFSLEVAVDCSGERQVIREDFDLLEAIGFGHAKGCSQGEGFCYQWRTDEVLDR